MSSTPYYSKSNKFDSIYSYFTSYFARGITFDIAATNNGTVSAGTTLTYYESQVAETFAMGGTSITAWSLPLEFSRVGNVIFMKVTAQTNFTTAGSVGVTASTSGTFPAQFLPPVTAYGLIPISIAGTITWAQITVSTAGVVTITSTTNFAAASTNIVQSSQISWTFA